MSVIGSGSHAATGTKSDAARAARNNEFGICHPFPLMVNHGRGRDASGARPFRLAGRGPSIDGRLFI
jgi:hypothetical protein